MVKNAQVRWLLVSSLMFLASSAWATLKIMPLGDSLTAGGYNQNGQWQVGGGYRVKLDSILKHQGLDFVFVGTFHNGPADFTNNAHEGHSGFRIEQLNAPELGTWLGNSKPDLILLMIGANDIIQNYDLSNIAERYEALLIAIENAVPQAKIIVANSIPTESRTWNSRLKRLSTSIMALVAKHGQAGHSLIFVNMYDDAGIRHNRHDLIDGVHPNPKAYEKLSPVWAKAILGE